MLKFLKEYKTSLIPMKIGQTDKYYTFTNPSNVTYKVKLSNEKEFISFLNEFEFYTPEKPITKTPNNYYQTLKQLKSGDKPTLYIYKNRADNLHSDKRVEGNPYKKEATTSANFPISNTINPKKKKKDIYKFLPNLEILECKSIKELKKFFY